MEPVALNALDWESQRRPRWGNAVHLGKAIEAECPADGADDRGFNSQVPESVTERTDLCGLCDSNSSPRALKSGNCRKEAQRISSANEAFQAPIGARHPSGSGVSDFLSHLVATPPNPVACRRAIRRASVLRRSAQNAGSRREHASVHVHAGVQWLALSVAASKSGRLSQAPLSGPPRNLNRGPGAAAPT